MKKTLLLSLSLILSTIAFAQLKVQLRSTNRSECTKSDMTELQASFSFSNIEAKNIDTKKGAFSMISLPNTVVGGNEGDPQIPVVNKLIAVPLGATPRVVVTSYSTSDFQLADLGIEKLVPRQPSLRKDQRPEEVPFMYNERSYQTRGMRSAPQTIVEVVGTMRGVQLGKLTIEPVSYDPVSNTLRVFNDIEVTVSFESADVKATEQLLVDTYSPYFDIVYKQLFNSNAIRAAYDGYPDLYTTPVKMLVVTTEKYTSSEPFQTWLAWKKQKGIDVDVQTVTSSTNGATVRSIIQNRYNANHPTFLVIVGDENDVTNYETYNIDGNYFNPYPSDNPYASVDNDIYHDLYMSRMAVSNTTELGDLIHKIMTYEKYTMSDPSYLDNAVLIAGYDQNGWDEAAGRPTIQYALNSYFNTEHGFNNVYGYVTSNYTGCYDHLNTGVGFVNYTAHGSIQAWSSPSFTNANVNALTNNDKYFFAVGNCCLTANWGNVTYTPCFGETMIRAAEKGAVGYIGSVVESYWFEDYYFGVGAHDPEPATVQTVESTMTGMYDALFDDTEFNSMSSLIYIGNTAVTYAHAAGYEYSVDDEYYWRAYQCLGDGSVMPYMTQPSVNQVTHASTLGIGMNTFVVNADAGSYVAITKDNEILGVAEVGPTGTVSVPITPVETACEVMIVVTRTQRQPYIQTIQAVTLDEPFIILDSHTPTTAPVGDDTALDLTFKNVGSQSCAGTTTVTLSTDDNRIDITVPTKSFNTLASNATTTLSGFLFHVNNTVAEGTPITFHYAAVNNSNTWEGDFDVIAGQAMLAYKNMAWDGGFVPGETLTLTAKFMNTGHYQATNAIATMSCTSNYVTISNPSITVGTIGAEEEVSCPFTITIAANCPEDEEIPVTFTLTADEGLSAQGTETLKNTCSVIFSLSDSYGDGWNGGAKLTVSFNDGTASQDLTVASGNNSATYTLDIHNGTHVTLTWTSGSYDKECSFTVSYEGDILIFQQGASPTAGVLFEFDCRCGAASAIFNVSAASSNTAQGTVSGGGEFGFGEPCTLTATPAEGYFLTGWSENGVTVSSANPYTFLVDNDHHFVANFGQGLALGTDEASNDYLPCYSFYEYALSQQIYTAQEIGGACTITSISFFNKANVERTRIFDIYLKHTDKSSFSSKTDWITMSASDKVFSGTVVMSTAWTTIELDSPFEYDGSSNLVLVVDDNTNGYEPAPYMSCSVYSTDESQALYAYSAATDYDPLAPPTSAQYNSAVVNVKNHLILGIESDEPHEQPTETQIITLEEGWSWWSTCFDTKAATLLTDFENALYGNGIKIQSKASGYVEFGNGAWTGTLAGIDISQMYKVNVSSDCEVTMAGTPVDPANCTITLRKGSNWIGFPLTEATDVNVALSNLDAANNDNMKSADGFVTYYGNGWYGSFSNLEPGQGYIYKSTASGTKTFTYTASSKGTVRDNVTSEGNYWTVQRGRFADNMNLIATVELDGVQQASDDLEVAAFVGGECRGSVKLIYVEPLNQHFAFLTIGGNDGETVTFKVLSNGNVVDLSETVTIHLDEVAGTLTAPFVLHNGSAELSLFPNPAAKGETIRMELSAMDGATVEIFNALGALVRTETLSQGKEIEGFKVAGLYTVKVTDQQGNVRYGKLVVR